MFRVGDFVRVRSDLWAVNTELYKNTIGRPAMNRQGYIRRSDYFYILDLDETHAYVALGLTSRLRRVKKSNQIHKVPRENLAKVDNIVIARLLAEIEEKTQAVHELQFGRRE